MKNGPGARLRTAVLALAGVGALTGLWASAQLPASAPVLSEWMPAGALLYLESADFAAQLADWNASDVKSEWLASVNRDEFLTTRLMLKLRDVYAEFSDAAGLGPDLAALETVAGGETAMALYDIRALHFLYVSRLPAARLAENVLTRARPGYQPRTAAGETYYVREAGDRVSAFAVAGEYLLVSTREDLIAASLALAGGGGDIEPLAVAPWYQAALGALPEQTAGPVPLRLVMDLPAVIETPYFRSYWIQKNVDDWRGYDAFLAQVARSAGALDETRVFVRSEEVEIVSREPAVVELGRHIPGGAGFFRLWDTASTGLAMDLIRAKFFAAGEGAATGARSAPAASLSGVVGSVADLRTRIDEGPRPSLEGSLDLGPMEALVESAGLEAVLHLESSFPADESVFVSSDAVVALRAASPWNAAEVRAALTAAVAPYQSVGGIGIGWRDVVSGSRTLSQLDGLLPLTVYVDGPTLWIARTPGLLGAALESSVSPSPSFEPGAYLARYDHETELQPYLKMMRMLDLSDPAQYSSFFSENVGSLASALDRIGSVLVRIDDDGRVQRQTVTYALRE